MAIFKYKRLVPTFIPLAFELLRHFVRDFTHNENIRKTDKSTENMANVEHLLVRLEKKMQNNRETFEKITTRLTIWLAVNSILLIGILVKLLFF